MSPLAFHRKITTPVRINPPNLSYVTQPTNPGTIANGGSATLTGIATVNYFTTGIGTIGYEWKDSTGIVGYGTALNLTNMTAANDNGRQITQYAVFYPDPTRVGIETFQPDASNSPLASDTITLAVQASITITQQPTSSTAGGQTSQATIAVSPATPNGTTSITLNTSNSFDNFAADVEYTLTPDNSYRVKYILDGAGGGGGNPSTQNPAGYVGSGGKGGKVTGEIFMIKNKSYKLVVGKGGYVQQDGTATGGQGGGGTAWVGNVGSDQWSNESGSGGGYTGIFDTTVAFANSLLIAGGGGGGAWKTSSSDPGDGGEAGGIIAGPGESTAQSPDRAGGGGTQTGGGTTPNVTDAANQAVAGSQLQGGNSSGQNYSNTNYKPSGGGGGGYYGGGGGAGGGIVANSSTHTEIAGGGGGGSGYINPDSSKVVNGIFGVASNPQNTGGKVHISLA